MSQVVTDPDVRESIMYATYEALCEHGYTELTAQDIADRTDKSKSSLFYHYDSKEELIADFVEYLLEWLDDRVAETEALPPAERLAIFVDWFLYGTDADERRSFHRAMLELRTQAPFNEVYREKLRKSDDRLRATLESILEDGIEAGQFVDHDTERTAALLIAAIDGARVRQLTLDRDRYLDDVRAAIVARIFDELLAEGVSIPEAPDPGEPLGRDPAADAPGPVETDTGGDRDGGDAR